MSPPARTKPLNRFLSFVGPFIDGGMYSISQVSKLIGISRLTLRRWEKSGKLVPNRTLGGHRRYSLPMLEPWLFEKDLPLESIDKATFQKSPAIYARVSTARQNSDGNLDRKAARLEKFARKRFGPKVRPILIKEYGSGLNPNRSGLWRLIRKIKNGEVSCVIVAWADRLSRFGVPFLEELFRVYGVPLIIAEAHTKEVTIEEELVNDLMTLMACFSGRLYKSRALKQTASERAEKTEHKAIEFAVAKAVKRAEGSIIKEILLEGRQKRRVKKRRGGA